MKSSEEYARLGQRKTAKLVEELWALQDTLGMLKDKVEGMSDDENDILVHCKDPNLVEEYMFTMEHFKEIKKYERCEEDNDNNRDWLDFLFVTNDALKAVIRDVEQAIRKLG